MKIQGKEKLLANDFDTITILQQNDVFLSMIEGKTSKEKNIKIGTFKKSLESRHNDMGFITEIIVCFLSNNTITKVVDYNTKNSDKKVLAVEAVTGKQLILSVNANIDKLIELILEKYKRDRLNNVYQTLNNNNVFQINISADQSISSYEILPKESTDRKMINLKYALSNDVLNFDKQFMLDFLKTYIHNCPNVVEIHEKILDFKNSKIFVNNSKLFLEISKLIEQHNYEIVREKRKQLKLEGF